MFKTGTYKALIKGVSQQTPQEREDGQLSTQVNMVSDIVNGLRRRAGFRMQAALDVNPNSFFNVTQLAGEYYVQAVQSDGTLSIYRLNTGELVHTSNMPYLAHTNKTSIRTAITRNQCFILNTEKVPTTALVPTSTNPVIPIDSKNVGWVYFISGLVPSVSSRSVTVTHPTVGTRVYTTTRLTSTESYVTTCDSIFAQMIADTTLTTHMNVVKTGTVISVTVKVASATQVVVTYSQTGASSIVFSYSGTTHVVTKRSDLPPTLPSTFDKYLVGVGGGISYIYDAVRNVWSLYDETPDEINPKKAGWVKVLTGAFSKQYSVSISQDGNPLLTFSVTTHASTAAGATSEYIATDLENQMAASPTFNTYYSVVREGTMLAIISKSEAYQLVVTATGGDTYIIASNASNTQNKASLPAALPKVLDGYIQSVGTGGNLAYFKYSYDLHNWEEVGVFEPRYTIQNTPVYWYFDYGTDQAVVESLDIQGRTAGDDSNNPLPKFLDYGITGIGAYQSRLVLLSGAYVYLSKSTDPTVFMRSTVTELLDTDAIEISATSLSNAQFEYAVPFNKDLVLVAQNQQAVIPNNSTVLTPKTAAIYPTTTTEISLACQPSVIARSLYYVYQRTLDFYQVGEFLPSPYTDSQYTTQSTTDHLPLYAEGVCTSMSGSTASNIACFSSDSPDVLINQYYWAGDERPLMCYHKWVLPRDVMYNTQVGSTTVFLVADGDKTLVVSTDIQLNQLGTKPVPFLDLYQYVEIDSTGVGIKPEYLPEGDLVAVIYDSLNQRHSEVAFTVDGDTILCKYTGTIAIGLRYPSEFTITPPFLRDANGNVVAGSKTTIHSLNFTLRSTGKYKYTVLDTYGHVADTDSSGVMWSEVDLGYTWIGSVVNSVVPCRTRLNSTEVILSTQSTTDLNVTTVEFSLRVPDRDIKRRR